jgi:hypothetical protein
MKRLLSGVLLIGLIGIGTLGAGGEDRGSKNRHFLGLWEGVDVNDGSKRTVSITDRDGDGTFEVASRDTYWTLCSGDRGLELATGRVRHDGVLATDGQVTCFEVVSQLAVQQTYEFSKREGTLYATPLGTGLAPLTLHRVSE